MRFKEFLTEWDEGEDPDLVEIKPFLYSECGPFFQRSGKDGLLFRGVNGLGSFECHLKVNDELSVALYRKKVRQDRAPMSIAPALSKIFDDYFDEKAGFRARSAGVFCIGENGRGITHGYGGNSCILFPIGNFSYVWSPEVEDLFDKSYEEFTSGRKLKPEFEGKKGKEEIFQWLDAQKYTINGLDKAVVSANEVIVDCSEVFLIQHRGNENTLREIRKALGIKQH